MEPIKIQRIENTTVALLRMAHLLFASASRGAAFRLSYDECEFQGGFITHLLHVRARIGNVPYVRLHGRSRLATPTSQVYPINLSVSSAQLQVIFRFCDVAYG